MFRHFDKELILGVDIGGSHISAALVNAANGAVLEETFCKKVINAGAAVHEIIEQWLETLESSLSKQSGYRLKGIGIAMPGPFDYENGICRMDGVNKYQSLYGINIKQLLKNRLEITPKVPVIFENDAACFGIGESLMKGAAHFEKVVVITLGTGFGAGFIFHHQFLKEGAGVPPGGCLYNSPFKNGIAEDYISSRWLIKTYADLSGKPVTNVAAIAGAAMQGDDKTAIKLFEIFGGNIAACLIPWLRSFQAECLIIGGSISKAAPLFLPALKEILDREGVRSIIKISEGMEFSAIAGAAALIKEQDSGTENRRAENRIWRKSSQSLMPQHVKEADKKQAGYNMYPFLSLQGGHIFSGYDSLAKWIKEQKIVVIDGYGGNDWNAIRENLDDIFKRNKTHTLWYEMAAYERPEGEVEAMVRPFISEPDIVWGKKTTLSLRDFYEWERLEALQPDLNYEVVILIGTGAALSKWPAAVIYIDLPKNEIQYRMRAETIFNLGRSVAVHPTESYKRFYFVDWVVLNDHRKSIKDKIAVIADGQWKDDITWAFSQSINQGLQQMGHNVIRVRPWFEAGAWGGQWLKSHIPLLNQDEVNYAWSFELIVPENGLVFESNGNLLEIAFDWLMEYDPEAILGKDAERFGTEFPIRFDFLDTFDGGNLSIQCHPSLPYIQENFGEKITQDETYYILDCKEDAGVWLGFREDIDAGAFRVDLESSVAENHAVEIEDYVQWHPAHKHDLFLIPNGTVHSSGADNLVLEISATPYIFTFKMYDWLRADLNGKLRPINIEHAFNNLNFDRKGEIVNRQLISRPEIIEEKEGYRLTHLPTHAAHFYDVHRIEFQKEVTIETMGKCHVLMLVEGQSVLVKTKQGMERRFNYAETFVIPAAAESYRLVNEWPGEAKLVKAFIK